MVVLAVTLAVAVLTCVRDQDPPPARPSATKLQFPSPPAPRPLPAPPAVSAPRSPPGPETKSRADPTSVTGVVLDDLGQPMEWAGIWIYPEIDGPRAPDPARTDAAGRYRVELPQAGDWSIEPSRHCVPSWPSSCTARRPPRPFWQQEGDGSGPPDDGDAPPGRVITVEEGREHRVDFRFTRRARVCVTVVGARPDDRVLLVSTKGETADGGFPCWYQPLEEDGTARMDVPAGRWIPVLAGTTATGPEMVFEPGDEREVTLYRPGGAIEGRVTDLLTGDPVPGAQIVLEPSPLWAEEKRFPETDAEGRFRVEGLGPGRYRVHAVADMLRTGAQEAVVGSRVASTGIELSIDGGCRLEVLVVVSPGNPHFAASACVSPLERPEELSSSGYMDRTERPIRFFLVPGRYRIRGHYQHFRGHRSWWGEQEVELLDRERVLQEVEIHYR